MNPPRIPANAVKRMVARAGREGPWKLLAELERAEPELAEYLFEALVDLHQRLLKAGLPSRRVAALSRQIQTLIAVTAICFLEAPPVARPRPVPGVN